KDTVTDAELAPYIHNGGIPNEATLQFTDNSGTNTKTSDKPVVLPPQPTTKKPTIKEVFSTGDNTNIVMYGWILMSSILGYILLRIRGKKEV
ncbi:MAG: hypothetical protein ACK5LC_12250, partial [Coprobacillaceae bacterium]